jgi:peptidoglycan hydrolase-like protein with peptidoglycan-binding domain
MAWRLAKSIKALLEQVNAENPHRRKDSDGGIGDAAHASRGSDHNPYIIVKGQGVVRAYDFTHAPETGFDAYAFAEMMLKNKDFRVRYIISNRKIASGKAGPQPWKWRPYECPPNKNPHNHHTHVSVTESEAEFDSAAKWNMGGMATAADAQAPEANNYVPPPATLRIKARGELVKRMQAGIGLKGVDVDGYFGPNTEKAVKQFQATHNLTADGIFGAQSWDALNKTAA